MPDSVPDHHTEPNPVTRAAFRRQVWLEIYLPLLFGLVVVVGGAVLLWQRGVGDPRAWADASTVLLLVPLIVASLIPLALLVGAAVGAYWLIREIPGPSRRVQGFFYRVELAVHRASDMAARPWVVGSSLGSAVRRSLVVLASIFRR